MSRILALAFFLATSLQAQDVFVPPVLKGLKGEGVGKHANKPIPFPAADEKWILARSKHFVFISSAGEKRTRETAAVLETLAAALKQLSARFSKADVETHVFFFNRHSDEE